MAFSFFLCRTSVLGCRHKHTYNISLLVNIHALGYNHHFFPPDHREQPPREFRVSEVFWSQFGMFIFGSSLRFLIAINNKLLLT